MSLTTRSPASRAIGAWLLLLPGVVASQPTFGGVTGYLPALIGATVGVVIALVAISFQWSMASWFLSMIGAYLIFGGPLAAPETMISNVVPSFETLRRLTLLVFQSWKDLLTAATPVGDLSGPQAAPLLAGLLVGALTASCAQLTRAVILPLLLPLAWLAFNMAFGVREAPASLWLGVVFGLEMMIWLVAHAIRSTRVANDVFLVRKSAGFSRLTIRVVSVSVVLAFAAAISLAVNVLPCHVDRKTPGPAAPPSVAMLPCYVDRKVLRDSLEPPLNMRDYASPLMKYRLYELTQKKEVLFRVTGMPVGGRLRLATLDSWDGITFNFSRTSSDFLRTGREIPWREHGDLSRAEVVVESYEGPWVPSFGSAVRVEFGGAQSIEQSRGFYFSRDAYQGLTTAGLRSGSTFSLEDVIALPSSPEEKAAMEGAGVGSARLAEVQLVPEVIATAANEWTVDAESAFDKLRAIEERFRSEGAYSNGEDNRSLPGHSAHRLALLMTSRQKVGSDEQYAAAMALMATQLGIPVRVVLGFYPSQPVEGEWMVTGEEAHVWVEAQLEGFGWVMFDPTPDRDKKPQTDTPKPKPHPKPQVDPPPAPPERIPERDLYIDPEQKETEEEDEPEDSGLLAALFLAGGVAGGLLLALSPFLAIALLKSRRCRLRRTRGSTVDRLAGAWAEVLDRARDMGFVVLRSQTRRENLAALSVSHPNVELSQIAHAVDAAVFGRGASSPEECSRIWDEAEAAKLLLLRTQPWHRRILIRYSTRSLRRLPKATSASPSGLFRRRIWPKVGILNRE